MTEKEHFHSVIPDEIPPTQFHGEPNGPIFTSRSKYEAYVKEKGFYILTEEDKRNAKIFEPPKSWTQDDLEEAARKAAWGMYPPSDARATLLEMQRRIKWGMAPSSEKDREKWKNEEQMYKSYVKRRKGKI